MKNNLLLSVLLLLLSSCGSKSSSESNYVKNIDELNKAVSQIKPGGEIVLANGVWKDVPIIFFGNGTQEAPITLRAETPGEVLIQGTSSLKLGGEYLVVDGLYFTNGSSPSEAVIQFSSVMNNYFYNLSGEISLGPLAVMNGIPRSPLNRYIQVTDVVVAYNTWVNCSSPWQFGVGSNIDQRDVLPPSEIRSVQGLEEMDFSMKQLEENIWVPSSDFSHIEVHHGFEFDQITKDLLGNSREVNNSIGATNGTSAAKTNSMDRAQYGCSPNAKFTFL